MSGTSFGTSWDFLTIFEQFSFFHWKSMIFRKNSKNPYFDLWDLLWWVFHMVLALNHWFRPKNEGSKKSVPQNCKSAGSDALKRGCTLIFKLFRNTFLVKISKTSKSLKNCFYLIKSDQDQIFRAQILPKGPVLGFGQRRTGHKKFLHKFFWQSLYLS